MELINQKILKQAFEDYVPEQEYIADNVVTKVAVKEKGSNFAIYKKYARDIVDTIVGNSGTKYYDEVLIPMSVDSYSAIERGLKTVIKDEDKKDLTDVGLYDLLQEKIGVLKDALLIEQEKIVATLIASGTNTSTPAVKWDASGAKIEKDIQDAIKAFEDKAGIAPNVIIIPYPVWSVMKIDPTLRDVWKIIPSIASEEKIKLSSLLEILFDNFEEIYITKAKYNTAGRGKTPVVDYIFSSADVNLLYVSKKATTSSFTAISKFIYQNFDIKQWRVNDPDGVAVKVYYSADIKKVSDNAIHRIVNVLT